jgi:hypothetical protein
VFVVVASRQPLPAYEQWVKEVGKAPWQPAQAQGAWRFDERGFLVLGGSRGPERVLTGPKPIEDLYRFFKDQANVDAAQAVAFPVRAKES